MSAEIYLIAPTDLSSDRLVPALAAMLDSHEVAALLLPRGALSDNAYKALAKSIVPLAQKHGAAVLVEGDPGIVRLLGADGLHVAGDAKVVKEALSALKPDFIVGVGSTGSRDEAMSVGELGVDYILFGPLSGAITAEERAVARWWAETMEVPSVLSDPQSSLTAYDAEGCEFIGLPLVVAEPAT
jgi:thiamine-phosphate pyrophosphorylase